MDLRNLLRGERGISIVKILISLVIIGIVLFVGLRYLLIRVHYLSVKDTVRVQAESAAIYPDVHIKREIVRRAKESEVTLAEEDIRIDRLPGERITISLSYRDSLPLFVKTFYFDFDIEETTPLPR